MPENDKPNKITMFAYGTNISQEQMLSHCPNAVLLGYGTLLNYELKFQGFRKHAIANLVKKRGAELPIAVYELEPEGRFTIDNYEKFPYNYAKKKAVAILNGQKIKGYIYVLKKKLEGGIPSDAYLNALRAAYWEADMDPVYIDNALKEVEEKKNDL